MTLFACNEMNTDVTNVIMPPMFGESLILPNPVEAVATALTRSR